MRELERSEPSLARSLEPFWHRLAETVAWSMHRLDARDPRGSLRFGDTRPRVLESDYFSAVRTAVISRSHHARDLVLPPLGSLERGRLLVYLPDMDLCDGAAEQISLGYFDVNNAPPWDTWIGIFADTGSPRSGSYLVSWVPPPFLSLVEKGIEVNPEQCILWLDGADVSLSRLLVGKRPA